MRFLFLDTNYATFLDSEYRGTGLGEKPYDEQMSHLVARRFGTSDYYSRNLRDLGHEAQDVIANCAPLQRTWWRENAIGGMGRPSLQHILEEQVRRFAPDVLYIQEMNWPAGRLLRRLRPSVPLVVGQTAYPLLPGLDVGPYDLIVSSFPHYPRLFELLGVPSLYLPLAFEPTVQGEAAPVKPSADVAFVGSYSHDHAPATRLLESIARQVPVGFWGPSVSHLDPSSPIRVGYRGPAWGLDMFRVLGGARISLNRHIEVAGPYANNMRLYEATGMGSLLLTDEKTNLPEHFEPGREVVTYRDADDAVHQVKWLLTDEVARQRIAKAGQARTLREHTYASRMRSLAEALEAARRRPRAAPRRIPMDEASLRGSALVAAGRLAGPLVRRLPSPLHRRLTSLYRRLGSVRGSGASGGYRPLKDPARGDERDLAWQDAAIVAPQGAVVRAELVRLYRGQTPPVFAAAAEAIRRTGEPDPLVIEVGCATGYYDEVLRHLLGRPVRYVGLDYSRPLLVGGRRLAPSRNLVQADAGRLPLPDSACDVLVSGCVLLHVSDWRSALLEAARASRRWVVLHRTPVVPGATRRFHKQAYGVEVAEWAFGEKDLHEAIAAAGLETVWSTDLHQAPLPGGPAATVRTYLCRKAASRPL